MGVGATLNDWLSGILSPEQRHIFHPGLNDKLEIMQKYPTGMDFVKAYKFAPDPGWYDPRTGLPVDAAIPKNNLAIDPAVAQSVSGALRKQGGVKK